MSNTEPLTILVALIIMGAVSYRVAHFISLDALIDESRDRFASWLESTDAPPLWKRKTLTLMKCPWCLTVWIAAFANVFHWLVVADWWPGWYFLELWIATAAIAMLFWAFIDSE